MFKTKQKGFTLIELLVVIVIIGILSTISTATFKSYFGKARDAERQAAVQNITMMIKVDSAQDSTDDKFNYTQTGLHGAADTLDLIDLFAENDFRAPKASSEKCYYYGYSAGGDGSEDNEFVVLVPGEDDEKPFVDGTTKGVNEHTNAIVNAATCAVAPTGTTSTYTYVKIDKDGGVSAVTGS